MSESIFVSKKETIEFEGLDEKVKINGTVGNAQAGVFSVFLESEYLGANEEIDAGTVSDLKGKKLLVSATIRDVRKETRLVSFLIEIKEGNREPLILGSYPQTVEEDLDNVFYSIVITVK